MQSFDTLTEWRQEAIVNTKLFLTKKSLCEDIWVLRQEIVARIELDAPLEKIKNFAHEKEIEDIDLLGLYGKLVKEKKLPSVQLSALSHFLFFLKVRAGELDMPTKAKNILVHGPPNVGKTSLLTRLRKILGRDLFYFVGARPDDFSGYHRGKRPLLVFDDLFRGPSKWGIHGLLKIFGNEKVRIDVKYGTPVVVDPCGRFILTNRTKFFDKRGALLARVRYYPFELPVD